MQSRIRLCGDNTTAGWWQGVKAQGDCMSFWNSRGRKGCCQPVKPLMISHKLTSLGYSLSCDLSALLAFVEFPECNDLSCPGKTSLSAIGEACQLGGTSFALRMGFRYADSGLMYGNLGLGLMQQDLEADIIVR